MNRHTGASDPLVKLAQDIDALCEAADRIPEHETRQREEMLASAMRRANAFVQADPPRQIAALQSAGIWAPYLEKT